MFFWGRENLRKMDAKMIRKSDQNKTKNHLDAGFVRFWGVLEGFVFSTFLGAGKSRPKILKNPILWAEMGARPSHFRGLGAHLGPNYRIFPDVG